jgi:hypothetical protein
MTVFIIAMIIWNIINTFFGFTALLASYRNDTEIEAIKSWYPFCEIMKIRIPKDKGGGDE